MAAEKSSRWWIVYAVVVIVGGPYAIFFTKWGPGAYEAICLLLFVYGLGAMTYTLIRPLFHHLRSTQADAALKRPIAEVEVQAITKTPFFHDDPSRVGKTGIGMPALINFGVMKTVCLILLFLSVGCLVHYLSAVPKRGETLLGLGFLSAVACYLWLLVKFAERVYRWLKRHTRHSTVGETQAR